MNLFRMKNKACSIKIIKRLQISSKARNFFLTSWRSKINIYSDLKEIVFTTVKENGFLKIIFTIQHILEEI